MDIILVRHGESEANISKVYGDEYVRLTKRGIDQAKASRPAIKKLDFEKVYVSPMLRARETMKHLGLDGEEDKNLREVNFGLLEGKTYSEFLEDYPKEAKLWTENPITYRLPEGESLVDTYKRVARSLDRIIDIGENAILICHDGVIKLALCYVFDNIDFFFKFKLDNLGVSKITIEDGYKYISYQNRVFC